MLMMPGTTAYVGRPLLANPGKYAVRCLEYRGVAHHRMQDDLTVVAANQAPRPEEENPNEHSHHHRQGMPIFGQDVSQSTSTGSGDHARPALMIMSSCLAACRPVWPGHATTQIFDLSSDHFYTTLTLHGAALTFPFSFQLGWASACTAPAAGRSGPSPAGCPALAWLSMNLAPPSLTVAVLMGSRSAWW